MIQRFKNSKIQWFKESEQRYAIFFELATLRA
jgi:hypothetical protein